MRSAVRTSRWRERHGDHRYLKRQGESAYERIGKSALADQELSMTDDLAQARTETHAPAVKHGMLRS